MSLKNIYVTYELIGINPKNITHALRIFFEGEWKKGCIPNKWDGKTAKQIVTKFI